MTIDTNCMLVHLHIRSWGAEAKDRRVSNEVAVTHNIASNVGRYTKKLVSEIAIKKIQGIASAARTDHYFHTLPWSQEGARILPVLMFDTYSQKLRAHKVAYGEQVALFVSDYPNLINDAKQRLNGLFNQGDYPLPSILPHLFAFNMTVAAVPNANDFRVALAREDVEQIKKDIEASTKAAVTDATRNTVDRMKDVVERMVTKLTGYTGKASYFRDSLVDNVRDLVAIVPKLNIEGDPEMDRIAKEMDRKLCGYDASALREDASLRVSVADEAAAILEKLKAIGGAA